MPAAIDTQVKKQVIKKWLSGDSRDRIAADNDIGAGTVTNIINEWKKGIEHSDYDSLRELAVYSKKEGFGLSDIASYVRLNNYIQKLGANQEQIETFIANLVNTPEPKKLIEVANQVLLFVGWLIFSRLYAVVGSCIWSIHPLYQISTFPYEILQFVKIRWFDVIRSTIIQ